MNRPLIALVVVAGCGLLAGCANHASAGTAVPPAGYLVCPDLAGPCIGVAPQHEPKSLLMSADGSQYAQHLSWTGWGTATATGHGMAELNNCVPDCAGGTYRSHPVTITLAGPEPWHHEMVYSRAAYSIPGIQVSRTFPAGLMPESVPR
jgi:hypothetical protein